MNIRNLIPHLAAFAVVAGCAWLAVWQVERAADKREIIERWHEREALPLDELDRPYSLPQPVNGIGIWDPSRQLLIDNMVRDRRSGVHVLTPLLIADGRLFLVNRGWAAWPSRTSALPDPDLPRTETEAEVRGVLNTPPETGIRLGESGTLTDEDWPILVTYFELDALGGPFGPGLQPAVIQLDPDHPAHLTGEPWKVVTFGPERHIGYAMTWTTIVVVVAAIWLVLTIRQARRRRS